MTHYEWMLRRLLVLNDYGFTIENFKLDGGLAGPESEFLTDDWLKAWYGKDGLPTYVWDELDHVSLRMSVDNWVETVVGPRDPGEAGIA